MSSAKYLDIVSNKKKINWVFLHQQQAIRKCTFKNDIIYNSNNKKGISHLRITTFKIFIEKII